MAMDSSHKAALSGQSLFLRACRCEPVERVPVWMMRQAGRYLPEYRALRAQHGFLEVCKTPELAAEVSLQPYRAFHMDAVIVFADILIPAAAMGLDLQIGDAGPVLANPVRDAAAVRKLRAFDPERETRFLCDAIRQLNAAVGVEVPILGFAGAPWTLACYMIEGRSKEGFPAAKQFLYSEPKVFRSLLEIIAGNTARYLQAQIAAGAAAVQLFDTWAGELNAGDYRAFALPGLQTVIREVKAAHPDVPVILYTKGSDHLLDCFAGARADVLSLDWRVDLAGARRRFGPRVALQGNVDPCILLGPPETIRSAVADTIEKTGGYGHILNLGHGILRNTPVENARLFIETAQSLRLAVVAQP
ncbi:MAG: uroporphyrinogen decarboxylase [Candidatus Acidiferrales bacterium]